MRTRLPNYREAVILGILINGEKYGREIRNEYERRTGEGMPLGSLYTTLHRMEKKGFVESRMGESVPQRRGNRRKYFEITAAGVTGVNGREVWHTSFFGGAANARP